MSAQLKSKFTYANVMATIAVFIALGGGAYAAFKLPNNSVGTKQIKNNAVNSAKVKNGSLLKGDFRKGQLPAGARGAQGPQGPQGLPGAKGDPGTPADSSGFYSKSDPFHVAGGIQGDTGIRLGSETGTTDPPAYPNANGLVIRRLTSPDAIQGEIVALVGGASLIRTANNQEFQVFVPPGGHSVTVDCVSESGGNVNNAKHVTYSSPSTTTLYPQGDVRDFLHCAMLDNTSLDQTIVTLQHGNGSEWYGTVMSTTNQ
jgi:hypothetical protein